jgi:predicted nucleotidyltransferase
LRLTPEQVRTIKEEAAGLFGPDAQVRLFGSRTNDALRGGDIDLLVITPEPIPERERKRVHFIARLQMRLGDQPIDVLVMDPGVKPSPVHESALATGVAL